MVIHTERGSAEQRLVEALRGTFDASVMNFGSYNLLYAENQLAEEHPRSESQGEGEPEQPELSPGENAAASRHMLVGYRREPSELVLCPLELDEVFSRVNDDQADAAPSMPAHVNYTNLVGVAADGDAVEIALSAGARLRLLMHERVEFDKLAEIPLNQALDVEDFYSFLDHFMDTLERTVR